MSKLAIHGGTPVFDKTHRWPTWPVSTPDDEKRVLDVMRGTAWGLGSPLISEFSKALADSLGVKHVLTVNSGTAALELIIKALGVGPGDEVIVPAYTFVASATCVLEMGATAVFADSDPATYNISPAAVAKLITPRTRAIVAVHFGGNPCDMDGLKRVIGDRKIALIEDAAHAHGMLLRGKPSGKHGIAAEFSYQSSKNMTCGEGGALATDDTALFTAAESFHSFGRKPGRPWYEHHNMSWNHRITAFQCALLLGQLERLEEQTQRRYENGGLLNETLAQMPGISPQICTDTAPNTRRAYHLYMWRHDAKTTGIDRNAFCKALEAEGVPSFGGYPFPLQENPMFAEHRYWHHHRAGVTTPAGEPEYRGVKTPVVTAICNDAVWITQPILLASRGEIQQICDAVEKVLQNASQLVAQA